MIKKLSLFSVFERVMKNDPDGSRKEQFKAFLREVRTSDTLIEQLAETYFEQKHASWKIEHVAGSVQLVGTPAMNRRSEAMAERRADSAIRVATATADLKARVRAVILLDLTLPNGKKLRDATGAECAKAGGFYTEVSRHLKPTAVVDKHLSEAELRNIQSRYEGSKRRSAAAQELRA